LGRRHRHLPQRQGSYKINGAWHGTSTPISTRTNQAGAFIPAGHYPIALAISGDGKTL